MTDMYNPTTGAHYMAQPSQIRVMEKSGWVVYADWLKNNPQPTAPTTDPTPAPAPAAAPADTATTTSSSSDSPVTLV